MFVRERAFGPPRCEAPRHVPPACTTNQYVRIGFVKNGGKIRIFVDRRKGFSERPEKVHFWKNQFQNLFQKSKNSNFAAIFVYIEYMNEFWIVVKVYYEM
jgi:hypothetical protein